MIDTTVRAMELEICRLQKLLSQRDAELGKVIDEVNTWRDHFDGHVYDARYKIITGRG